MVAKLEPEREEQLKRRFVGTEGKAESEAEEGLQSEDELLLNGELLEEKDEIYEFVLKNGIIIVLFLAFVSRGYLIIIPDFTVLFQHRVELATAMTSWPSLKEVSFLLRNSIPAYDFAPCRPVPLMVALLESVPWSWLPFVLADFVSARLLWLIGTSRGLPREHVLAVMALYLLNPVTVMTSVGRSAASLLPPLLLGALWNGQRGNGVLAMICLAMATYTSLYPIITLIPLLMLLRGGRLRSLAVFIGNLAALLGASRVYTGSWAWLESTWGCCLFVKDLRPNVGLAWYLFIEMFDHFRSLFVAVFQLNTIFHLAPICIKFSFDPWFAFCIMTAIQGLFKPYPTALDFCLTACLLLLHSKELYDRMKLSFFCFLGAIVAFCMAPINWYFWIHQGSGNANFYYANTLIWNASQIAMIVDAIRTRLLVKVIADNPDVNEAELYMDRAD